MILFFVSAQSEAKSSDTMKNIVNMKSVIMTVVSTICLAVPLILLRYSHPSPLCRPEPYSLQSNPNREYIYSVFGQICPKSENSRVFQEKADPEKERRYRKSARTENRSFQS